MSLKSAFKFVICKVATSTEKLLFSSSADLTLCNNNCINNVYNAVHMCGAEIK